MSFSTLFQNIQYLSFERNGDKNHLDSSACSPVIKRGDILVEDDKIIAVSPLNSDSISSYSSSSSSSHNTTIIDGTDKLLLPGFINCHTHAYMTMMRNSADDVSFNEWLFEKVMPREDKMTTADAYWATRLAIGEMLMTGTTCFMDMHMFPDAVAPAVLDGGIRAVLGRGLAGGDDPDGHRRLEEARCEIDKYKDEPTLSFSLAPHAIYTCTPELLKIARDEANRRHLPLQIHLSESQTEIDNCQKEHDCSPVAFLEKIGLFNGKTLIAHVVWVSDDDIEILAKNKVNVIHNPSSNLKLGNGIAPLQKFLQAGINVCLGTDGAASNNALNLFNEMRLAVLLAKGTNRDASLVKATEVIKMVTVNSALALGDDSIGEIAVGKKADLTMLDLNLPNLLPNNDLIAALCYSATGREVVMTMVEGKVVMKEGKIIVSDWEKVREEMGKRKKNNY